MKLWAQMEGVSKSLTCYNSMYLENLQRKLWEEYEKLLIQKEVTWYQKFPSKWLLYGDKNTNFFHASTIVQKKCRIDRLRMEGDEQEDDEFLLKTKVVKFFKNWYFRDKFIFQGFLIKDFFLIV